MHSFTRESSKLYHDNPEAVKGVFLMAAPIEIVPRNKSNGTDFCGRGSYQYIIRSDLGCYIKAYHVRDGVDPLTIHPLHPSCAWGDHYLAIPGYFYIIKHDECRRVEDLRTGANPKTFKLHDECMAKPENCFYMATSSKCFYIIRANNTFLYVKNMSVSGYKERGRGKLQDECIGGLYYWATKSYLYFLKAVNNNWGLNYHRIKLVFRKNKEYPVYPPITAFLPGGLAVIMGRTCKKWELIKTLDNEARDVPLKCTEGVIRKNGYKKQILHSVERKFNIMNQEGCAELTTEMIGTTVLKKMFSLSKEYGGCEFDWTKEDWTEEQEVKDDHAITVQPGEQVYIWQLKLCIKKEDHHQDVFYTQQLDETTSPDPPNLTN